MILKKRQLVTSALVLALGAAVFVNWYYTKPHADVVTAQSGESATQAAENLGDAQYVISDRSEKSDPFAAARLKREKAYSEAKETLQQTITDSAASQAAVAQASDALAQLTKRTTTEADLETLIEAKTGLENLVILGEDSAEVLLPEQAQESALMLQISVLVVQKTGFSADRITIIEAS